MVELKVVNLAALKAALKGTIMVASLVDELAGLLAALMAVAGADEMVVSRALP